MTIQKFEVPDWIRSVLICDPTDIWGNVVGMGLSELLAVLSPTNRFDRRGDVFWWDGFECGIGSWVWEGYGDGKAIEASAYYPLSGGLNVKLTAGSTSLHYAEIAHFHAYPSLTKIGFEYSFIKSTYVESIHWLMVIYTGTKLIWGEIKYVVASTKLQYWGSDYDWHDLATGISLYSDDPVYHTGKLVIDPSTKKYVRFLLGKEPYDMSDIAVYLGDDPRAPYLMATARVVGESGQNGVMYVDDAILTQNEPA